MTCVCVIANSCLSFNRCVWRERHQSPNFLPVIANIHTITNSLKFFKNSNNPDHNFSKKPEPDRNYNNKPNPDRYYNNNQDHKSK